jgi:hypothetical protein
MRSKHSCNIPLLSIKPDWIVTLKESDLATKSTFHFDHTLQIGAITMVRYFIAAAAICSAASLAASADAAKHQKRRHLRKLQASVPTYFPTLSPIADELESIQTRSIDLGATTGAASSSTSMGSTVMSAGTITVKDDSWKCSAQPIEVNPVIPTL